MNRDDRLLNDAQMSVELAHFNVPILAFNFSKEVCGPDELRRVAAGEDIIEVISAPLLAHEISHAFYVTATPSGLRQFVTNHAIMSRDARLIHEAAACNHGVLRPGIAMIPNMGNETNKLKQLRTEVLAAYVGQQLLDGGSVLDASELHNFNPDLARRSQYMVARGGDHPLVYCDFDPEKGTVVQLGESHLVEGIATAIEFERWMTSGSDGSGKAKAGPAPNPPSNPYRILWEIYRTIMENITRCPEPLVEFIAVADTALLMDDQVLNHDEVSVANISSAVNFVILIEILKEANGSLSLVDPSPSARRQFQTALLAAAGATSHDLREIINAVKVVAKDTIENDHNFRVFPDESREKWIQAFDWSCNLRLEYYDGANAYDELIMAPVPTLRIFSEHVSTMTQAGLSQMERRHLIGEGSWAFGAFMEEHIPSVLSELSFVGRKACRFYNQGCQLDKRPACHGVSDSLSAPDRQCLREAALQMVMNSLGFSAISET